MPEQCVRIYGGQSGSGTDLSQSGSVFPRQYHAVLIRKTKGQSQGTFKKQCSLGNQGALDRKVLSFILRSVQTLVIVQHSLTNVRDLLKYKRPSF